MLCGGRVRGDLDFMLIVGRSSLAPWCEVGLLELRRVDVD